MIFDRISRFVPNERVALFIYDALRFIFSPPSNLPAVSRRNFRFLGQFLKGGGTVLNLGGGFGGTGLNALRDKPEIRLLFLDLKKTPDTAVITDLMSPGIAAGAADCVILQGVLEHVEDDGRVLAEAARMLKPDGIIYAEVPFMQGYHPDPGDFRRYTGPGICGALERAGFSIVKSGPTGGPGAGLMAVTRQFFLGFPLNGILRFLLTPLVRWALMPMLILDLFIRPDRHSTISPGFFAFGRKNPAPALKR